MSGCGDNDDSWDRAIAMGDDRAMGDRGVTGAIDREIIEILWILTNIELWECAVYQLFRVCENRIYELSENTPGYT